MGPISPNHAGRYNLWPAPPLQGENAVAMVNTVATIYPACLWNTCSWPRWNPHALVLKMAAVTMGRCIAHADGTSTVGYAITSRFSSQSEEAGIVATRAG
jgi:hypothetical protein